MKDQTAALGIKMTSHGVNGFGKNHDANRQISEFAKKAGLKNISADPSEDSFDSLDKLVEEYGIRIAIHNHGPGARYSKVVDVLNAVKDHHKDMAPVPIGALHPFGGRSCEGDPFIGRPAVRNSSERFC